MDLLNTQLGTNTDNHGERQVSNPLVRNGRVIFTTLLPSADPCDFGGSGWLMEIDLASGSRLEFSPFDLDADGDFTEGDFIYVSFDANGDGVVDSLDKIPASGIKSKVGIIFQPAVLSGDGVEYKYASGSTGAVEITTENPGPGETGRQSWRQLR